MINFKVHLAADRLTEYARIGRPSVLSGWEQKHMDNCVECLRAVISTLKKAIEKNQNSKPSPR